MIKFRYISIVISLTISVACSGEGPVEINVKTDDSSLNEDAEAKNTGGHSKEEDAVASNNQEPSEGSSADETALDVNADIREIPVDKYPDLSPPQDEGKGCPTVLFCSKLFDPHTCSSDQFKATGSNKCEAMNNLKDLYCRKDIPFKSLEESVNCVRSSDLGESEVLALPSKKEEYAKAGEEIKALVKDLSCEDSDQCKSYYHNAGMCGLSAQTPYAPHNLDEKELVEFRQWLSIRHTLGKEISSIEHNMLFLSCLLPPKQTPVCHENKCQLEPPVSIPPFPEPECDLDYMCTEEYNPTICASEGLTSEGSNPCHAKATLKKQFCKQGLKWDESKVVCESSSEKPKDSELELLKKDYEKLKYEIEALNKNKECSSDKQCQIFHQGYTICGNSDQSVYSSLALTEDSIQQLEKLAANRIKIGKEIVELTFENEVRPVCSIALPMAASCQKNTCELLPPF